MRRVTHSETETAAVGKELAASLAAGDVIVLAGDLGAGKTAFVRGVAEGLGIDPSAVSSPTFTLVQEYEGRLRLWHIDAYRLRGEDEAVDLGLEEMVLDGSVVAIEWPDRLLRPFDGAVAVTLAHADGDSRTITVETTPAV